ncbi:acyl-CoA dehydrogenase family protein [Pseudohalioglobus lutimaris]|uniref:Acyl-CoA dehydrogenase n=1 Tax=Pseudohalioglobus lutimaris TaxID=1737061 RepID=A0A2N5X3X9_9GAMM|nr:acyl-CoA dehydrogenase family protein [Pseudohalioglobus lutimaris]PLW69195.1 acyl-CoA dehydrogenase [Pseudohalioglobus lutimaris]
MDLKFTEEQHILRDMVRSMVEDHSTTAVVREMEHDKIGVPTGLWQQMSEMGLTGMMLPEEYGGIGLDMVDCALIYEELGRGLAPGPHFVSSVIAVGAISRGCSEQQKAELFPAMGSGELIVAPAWLEPDNGFGPLGVQMRAENDGDTFVLNGVKRHVFYARAAQKLLVLARTGDAEADVDLFLVDTDAEGVTLEQQRSMAYDTQYKVTFTDVAVPAANKLSGGWSNWHDVLMDGCILQAAYAVGAAQQALDITVRYANEREQFDKPIGAFQALAHYMADAQVDITGAQVLVWEAAWAHREGKSVARLAPMAKLFCCNANRDATAKCEQIHGGYGFTMEYDIQLYFRRAKQQQMNWLDSRTLEDMISADILDTDAITIVNPFKV